MERGVMKNISSIPLDFKEAFVIGSDTGNGNMYAIDTAKFRNVSDALMDALQVVIVEAVSACFEGTDNHMSLVECIKVCLSVGVSHIENAQSAAAEGMTYAEFNATINE